MIAHVALVTFGSDSPMGQQHHESTLSEGLERHADRERWGFTAVRVAPMRSAGGDVRVPLGALWKGPGVFAAVAGALAYRGADLVHRFDLRLPPRGLGREVVTVHDLPPLRFDDEGTVPPWAARSARRARLIICPSAFAAEEVATLLGQTRIRVVPNGVSETFRQTPAAGPEVLARYGMQGRFVLHAGGATKRKNLAALAEAWRRMATSVPDVTLTMCGPPDPRRKDLFAGLPRVRWIGHLAQRDVAALMRVAAAVVVPSLYEGFGLPALEGMACGAPVVAADCGALPEVCGDAALLVAPTADALAEGIEAVLTDDVLAGRLRAAGPARAEPYTWEHAARATLAAYEEALR